MMKTHQLLGRGLLFALPLLLCVSSPAVSAAEEALLDEFEFPGGTLLNFAESYRETASRKFGAQPNIVVSPPAESRNVPAISVRSVSTTVLLDLVARLAGVQLETIEPGGDIPSAPVHIFSVPETGAGAFGHYGGGFGFAPSGGQPSGAAAGTGSLSGVTGFSAHLTEDPANELPATPVPTTDPALGSGLSPLPAVGPFPLTQPGTAQPPSGFPGASPMILPGLPSPYDHGSPAAPPAAPRFVIPMFTGFLFDESEEGQRKQDDFHKILAAYLAEFFPETGSDLSMHRESGIVIVESSSQQAIDFVRAFLDARREAELFRLKKQQVDAGVQSAEILLEERTSNR